MTIEIVEIGSHKDCGLTDEEAYQVKMITKLCLMAFKTAERETMKGCATAEIDPKIASIALYSGIVNFVGSYIDNHVKDINIFFDGIKAVISLQEKPTDGVSH